MWNLYEIRRIDAFLTKKQFRGKYIIRRLLKSFLPELADDLVVKTKYGYKLKISPLTDKGIEKKVFDHGVYEEGTLWCFKQIIKRNDVVFDVGANIGLTTIYASILSGKNGKVFAFEPLESTYKILLENLKINRVKNVVPINSALSDEDGYGYIFENLHINRGAASLISNSITEGLEVRKEKLDTFISKNNIDNINFIKIDIEGSELPMLEGSSEYLMSSIKPIICIEFSKDVKTDYDVNKLFYLLKDDLGYDIYTQLNGKESLSPLIEITELKDLPFHDNLYCFQKYHYRRVSKRLFGAPNLIKLDKNI